MWRKSLYPQENLLADKGVDLVDIILPHDMYYPVCEAIFTWKPAER
jgi:hypothetical protein